VGAEFEGPFPYLNSDRSRTIVGPAGRLQRGELTMNDAGEVEAAISVVNLRVSYGDREILARHYL